MTDISIRLCVECEEQELTEKQGKYCGMKCYKAAMKKIHDRRSEEKKKARQEEPESRPEWSCPNGHKSQLGFDPKKDPIRWRAYQCPICESKVEEQTHEDHHSYQRT